MVVDKKGPALSDLPSQIALLLAMSIALLDKPAAGAVVGDAQA